MQVKRSWEREVFGNIRRPYIWQGCLGWRQEPCTPKWYLRTYKPSVAKILKGACWVTMLCWCAWAQEPRTLLRLLSWGGQWQVGLSKQEPPNSLSTKFLTLPKQHKNVCVQNKTTADNSSFNSVGFCLLCTKNFNPPVHLIPSGWYSLLPNEYLGIPFLCPSETWHHVPAVELIPMFASTYCLKGDGQVARRPQ